MEQNKTQEDANSIWQAIKEAIREISHNVGDVSNRLYARRTTSWKDFVDKMGKKSSSLLSWSSLL